ncbi:unnamed protein product [Rotaria magnacalcarata]|nr:unnamed protein product [Rotaria magnacalcarata]CAF4546485.1 unnamed protein product [Rotaria magnacalcarata]
MNNNVVLTCHQCTYHLQDKDLSETRIFTNEEIVSFQNYQSKKVFELYSNLYGAGDVPDVNVTTQPQPQQQQQQNELTVMNDDNTPRRKCELCSKLHSYGNIFVLNCNCKICYNCFANEVNRQRTITNELLICSLCRSQIKHNDLSNLRLTPDEIQAIQSYQQGKLFEAEHAVHFSRQKSSQMANNDYNHDDDDDDVDVLLLNQQQYLPKYWTLPMLTNFSRHTLDLQSTEYIFVADRFQHSWANLKNQLPAPVPSLKVVRRPRLPRSAVASTPIGPPPAPTLIGPPPALTPIGPPPTLIGPPLAPTPMGLPQSSVFVPSINNHAATQLQAVLLQRIHSIQVPNTNGNNGSATNQQQQQYHGFRNLSYNLSLGTNPMAPQSSGSLPMHHSMPFLSQSVYGSNILNTAARGPPPMPPGSTQPVARLPAQPRPTAPTTPKPEIIQIERIQNQRWFKQYSAHKCEFRQKLGKQTEQWLFHGCDERSSKNIEVEWFNRSYAGQHAVAFGQGCYFARDALYSHNYALPDRNGIRRMFLARVLIGNTTQGNSTMRVAPPGYDTTGDGQSIFVTYHDSQAYAEYLISYR